MHIQSLSGKWEFRQTGTDDWLLASVPGSVHTDLMNLDLIPDPFIRDNELKVMWVAEKNWEYQTRFIPNDDIFEEDEIFLVADGLDTIAEISLNSHTLGKVNNQFRKWQWNIKEFLLSGENLIQISFSGPSTYVTHKQKVRRMKGVTQAIDGGPHMRKAPCQFGWDWGPMLPSIGIWKDIRLEGRSIARLNDVQFQQFHESNEVTIQSHFKIDQWKDSQLSLQIEVTSPDGGTIQKNASVGESITQIDLKIEDPVLWWPNGYGTQDLYHVEVILLENKRILDGRKYDLGLRKIELRQNNDEFGKSFQFVVNNVPIFAKGSNWIPAHSFLEQFSDERLEKIIGDAAASHQNMLRVWGGGIYEEERFYDLCDKYGILVWQDFIFSCSIYPLDDGSFLENVRIEVEENIRRLRHRASLALWCGNNEMEWGWESWGWQKHPMEDHLPSLIEQFPEISSLLEILGDRDLLPDWEILKSAYDRLFHTTLPEWISDLDPSTPYWPSSPSSNTPFHDANGQAQGDAHFWDVWHGRKPFTAYRDSFPRFMSEFGFQAFPSMETIEYYTEPEDRNLTSYVMEHHQRGNHGNGLIIAQMTDTFKMPKDFAAWIYLSLILQAEGIRYGVEHWRRNMHRVSGTLYWQLNDCWPVASWASIDYFGRWKALHYAAKRFYAPILLSIEDKPPIMDLNVSSDLTEVFDGTIKWWLETVDGDVRDSGSIIFTANPLANTQVHTLDFSGQISKKNERNLIFICELWKDSKKFSTSIGIFVPNKHVAYQDPDIHLNMIKNENNLEITATAKSTARFVELKIDGADVTFSDNYFDIPAGRSVTVSCKIPDNWSLEKANEALKVYSLYNSF